MTTQPTQTLADRLTQQLDAEEALARAAAEVESASWWVDGPAEVSGKFWVYATGEKFNSERVGAHIAAQDPAATLARIAGIRSVLALHTFTEWGSVAIASDPILSPVKLCDECRDESWPCPTVRALAQMYAGLPA